MKVTTQELIGFIVLAVVLGIVVYAIGLTDFGDFFKDRIQDSIPKY